MITARIGRNAVATLAVLIMLQSHHATAQDKATNEQVKTVSVWTGDPPKWNKPTEAERDTSGADGRKVANKSVIRLGFVSTPELHLYPASGPNGTETTVVICPGGGYSILAWDLEGTEIAQWLQSIGVSAAVLKYRVPTRNETERWLPPVQDIQRSISLLKSGAIDGFDPKRVGVLGFSAGGNAAARAATAIKRHYEARDDHDKASMKPDFAVLVYPAWLVNEDQTALIDEIKVTKDSPPMFFAHAANDRVTCMSSVILFSELHKHQIPSALHVFADGGHGFGARESGTADDHWPALCEAWMRDLGWLKN